MSSDISLTDARDQIGPITNRVEYRGETGYLTKHGRRSAALVHPHAAELLEDLEELIDIESARVCKPLTGLSEVWRIRVGGYRVRYTIEDGELVVLVITISTRDEVYRMLKRKLGH